MILEVQNLTKRFGGLVAVDGVSFALGEGEILGIIGPNGAGKSTLLNCIAGAYRPTAGKVVFAGRDITGYSAPRACWAGIARTFQIGRAFPKLSALENVVVAATFGRPAGISHPLPWAQEMLEFTGFPAPPETLAGNLNGAQLRRLDLARALASKPRLLLLDECAAGLTPVELEELQRLILEVRDRGVSVLVVEHVLSLIMRLCDRAVVLHYGKKIAEGAPGAVVKDPAVAAAYLGDLATV